MLIQTAFNLLPDKKACNNGAVLFGSAVSAMSSGLSQLSYVKFLGFCNYQVMRSTYNAFISGNNTACRLADGVGRITKGYSESHKVFYASTPISKWIGVIVAYESGSSDADASNVSFSPQIDISIKALHDAGSGYTEIGTADYGVRLDSSNALLLASIEASSQNVGETRSITHFSETGINIPNTVPANTQPVEPRPLYIPPSIIVSSTSYDVRGSIISINIDCLDCKLKSAYVFDIYAPEIAI